MSPRNFTLNTYTNATWTDLAKAPAVIRSIIIANTTAAAIVASLRLSDGPNTERAQIVPGVSVAANSSITIDLGSLSLGRSDILQAKAAAAGVHFCASGEIVEED